MDCHSIFLSAFILFAILLNVNGAQDDLGVTNATSTTLTKRLFTYAGPLLPSDWTLVSILNDRAVIGFNNGSARNALLDDLDSKDKAFLQRLQNGTTQSTPLSSAKEKIAQWSSTVTSTVSKLGKSVRDQFDSLINNNNNKSKDLQMANYTITQVVKTE